MSEEISVLLVPVPGDVSGGVRDHVVLLLQLLELHHGVSGLVLDKVEESLRTSLTPVLFLAQDSVPDELDGGIFCEVKSGARRLLNLHQSEQGEADQISLHHD